MFWTLICFGRWQPCFPFTFEFYINAQTLKNNILQNIINPPYYTVLLASKTINHYVHYSWWNCNPSSISFCREKSPKNPMLQQWFRTKKFELIRDTALFQRCTVPERWKLMEELTHKLEPGSAWENASDGKWWCKNFLISLPLPNLRTNRNETHVKVSIRGFILVIYVYGRPRCRLALGCDDGGGWFLMLLLLEVRWARALELGTAPS